MIKQGLHTKHARKNQSATGCLLLLEEAVEKFLWENAFFFFIHLLLELTSICTLIVLIKEKFSQ